MSKSQEIRDALAGGAMTFAELQAKVGGDAKKLAWVVGSMRGEIRSMGRGDQRSLSLKAGGGKRKGAAKRAAKKKHGKAKDARRTHPHPNPPPSRGRGVNVPPPSRGREIDGEASRQAKLTQHVLTTFAALKGMIDIDANDETFSRSLRAHEEALELLAL